MGTNSNPGYGTPWLPSVLGGVPQAVAMPGPGPQAGGAVTVPGEGHGSLHRDGGGGSNNATTNYYTVTLGDRESGGGVDRDGEEARKRRRRSSGGVGPGGDSLPGHGGPGAMGQGAMGGMPMVYGVPLDGFMAIGAGSGPNGGLLAPVGGLAQVVPMGGPGPRGAGAVPVALAGDRRGGVSRGGPEGVGPLSPGAQVGVGRVVGRGLPVGTPQAVGGPGSLSVQYGKPGGSQAGQAAGLPPRTRGPTAVPCTHPGCARVLPSAARLAAHIRRVHSLDGRRFPCTFPGCAAVFKESFNLKRHARSHTDERPFPCLAPGCGKAFAHKQSLDYHVAAAHTTARSFRCTVEPGCTLAFPTVLALRAHVDDHVVARVRGGAKPEDAHAAAVQALTVLHGVGGASGDGSEGSGYDSEAGERDDDDSAGEGGDGKAQ